MAQFKGYGTVNGDGEYGFLMTAVDGQSNGGGGVDKLRLKVWDRATHAIIYDNGVDTPLDGGQITIHK